ncbi:MAG TPA: DUF3108 domain-containing protein [Gemmatimonadaceae bacterium]|nr:DUF3108 domain-containing protein [Gemmatimonadaceae bacterium]
MQTRLRLLIAFAIAACSERAATRDSATTAVGTVTAMTAVAEPPLADTALTAAPSTVASGRPAPVPRRTTRSSSSARSATPNATTAGQQAAPAARDTIPPATPATNPQPEVPQPVVQQPAAVAEPTPAAPKRAEVPFATGERLVYDVKFGAIDVGDATMEVRGVEEVRGRETYHTIFVVKGGTLFYKVNDRYESWMDVFTLSSLRHHQQIDEGSYERERKFEIIPGETFRENDKPAQPTVAEPLDDGSFFFFIRTIPLEVGKTYEFNRYFRPDRNPVRIHVARRERIRVPAGTFDALVLRPNIRAKGVFGEGGQAEIWVADDSTRVMLQMKSRLKFGSLNLYLKRR